MDIISILRMNSSTIIFVMVVLVIVWFIASAIIRKTSDVATIKGIRTTRKWATIFIVFVFVVGLIYQLSVNAVPRGELDQSVKEKGIKNFQEHCDEVLKESKKDSVYK